MTCAHLIPTCKKQTLPAATEWEAKGNKAQQVPFITWPWLGAGGGGVGPGAAFTNTKHSAVFVLHNLCLKESWLLLLGCACDFSLWCSLIWELVQYRKFQYLNTWSRCVTRILYVFAAGGWSGDNDGYWASLGHDAVPVHHPGPDTVPGLPFLPWEPSLSAHQPRRGKQGGSWCVLLIGVNCTSQMTKSRFPTWHLSYRESLLSYSYGWADEPLLCPWRFILGWWKCF